MSYKQCTKCKLYKLSTRDYFYCDRRRSKNGLRAECINCTNKRRNLRRRLPTERYARAKNVAKNRHIEFSLTKDQYVEIIKNTCYYCKGYFPSVKIGIGLDRINNDKGYTVDNIVPCCTICNSIKNKFLSQEETKAAVKAIIKVRNANKKK